MTSRMTEPITLAGVGLVAGIAQGIAQTCLEAVSVARIDPETGILHEPGHALDGFVLAGKILVFPAGKGSSSGSYVLMNLAANKAAPRGIVIGTPDAVVVAGAVLAQIPLVACLDPSALSFIHDGDSIRIDGAIGLVRIL